MAGYCARADLYAFGVPRGAFPNPGRLALSVDTSANTIALGDHGFEDGNPLYFRAEMGGSLPSPLVAGTVYYAINVSADTFQVAATDGGAALDLTTAGSEILILAPLPIDQWIEWGAEVINQAIPSHAVPLTAPYPPIVAMLNAELAAAKGGYFTGGTSKSLVDMLALAQAQLEKWGRGVPIRGENTAPEERTNLAASASVPYCDARGWGRYGGI